VSAASLSLPVWNAGPWPAQRASHRDRFQSAIGVAIVHALIGYALVTGLGFTRPLALDEPLKLFNIPLVPPPPAAPEPAPRIKADRPEGAAAPPNLEARPRPVVAPTPRIRIEVAQQIGAAPVAGTGPDNSAGASTRAGPGTGAGGAGTGTGSGGAGPGTGSGGIVTPARHVSGQIDDRDYPRTAYRDRSEGVVTARLTVATDGRVSRCVVTRSSGSAELDEATCRLIERRFRYEPARDAAGKAVVSDMGWRQTWWLERR
jgi:protein TonB